LPDKELVGPAFIHHPNLPYDFVDFLDAYHAKYGAYPRMEIAAIHEYGPGFAADRSDYEYVRDALINRGYDVKIWVTELGYFSTDPYSQDAADYLGQWMDFCSADSSCEYLNWFGPTRGDYDIVPLLENGELTPTGQTWVAG